MQIISMILSLLCGVALFLFGMSLMGDGLKRVAGNKLETFTLPHPLKHHFFSLNSSFGTSRKFFTIVVNRPFDGSTNL